MTSYLSRFDLTDKKAVVVGGSRPTVWIWVSSGPS